MDGKLSQGPKFGYGTDVAAGLSRGPNTKKLLNAASWSGNTWPAPGATLDLDFANNRGFIRGQGQGGVMDAITFTRGSNGTYVGPDGLLKNSAGFGKNLLRFPQDFDNAAWIKQGGLGTVAPNSIIAPDNTLTADVFTAAISGESYFYQASPLNIGDVATFSIFAKAGTSPYLQISLNFSGGQDIWIDMSDGSIALDETSGSAVSTPVGDGWYRITVSNMLHNSANKNILIGVSETGNNTNRWAGIGKTVYVWGAQLEVGSTATEYFPTNINTPRFDWDSNPNSITKNLLTYTEDFTKPVWQQIGVTITPTTDTPSPSITALLVTASVTTVTNSPRITQSFSFISGVQYTHSVRAKYNGRHLQIIPPTGAVSSGFANFDLQNGVVGSLGGTGVTHNIAPLGNGWYLCSATYTSASTTSATPTYSLIPSPTSPRLDSYLGDGTSGVKLAGAQLEVGSAVTSYQSIGNVTYTNRVLAASPTTNGILIEEARTNLLLWSRDATQTPSNNLLRYSQTFTNAAWTGATGLTGSQQIAAGTTPYIVCTSSDGTSVYVGNSGSILIYTRDASTGALTANGSVTVNNFGLCISSDGTSVYATSSGNTVAMYTRNTSTGALTANGTIAAGTNPAGICISADGTSVYVANGGNTISIYTRNTSTGALTANGTIATGTNLRTVIISSDGISVYTNNGSIYTRNTSTGALTANGTITTSSSGICISPDGTSVYTTSYAGSGAIILYTRNTTTGALTASTSVGGILATNMAVSLDGSLLYAVDGYYSIIFICTRNTTTGALTTKSTITPGAGATNIDISPDNLNAYVTNSTGTVSIYNAVSAIATVTDNTFTAPDSTTTAATVTATTAGAVLRQTTPTISSRQCTFSVYLYRKTGTGNVDITFDGNTFTTQPVTGAWTRYSISGSKVVSPTFGIRLATAGDEVYIWGAQLEYGSTPTTYEVTTASPAIWAKQDITAALDQTGIDGVANSATSLTATAANGICIQIAAAASIIKTVSVYLKAITVTGNIQVSIDGSTWSTVDLSNGLWNRIALTATLANPVVGILIQNSGDSVAMDYGQIENSTFATTPIFTTSATATRAIDSAFIPNNITKNFFNWNNGTIFAKGAAVPVNTSGTPVNIGDGTYYRAVSLNFAGSSVVGINRNSDSFTFPGGSANIPYQLTLNVWNNLSLAGSWSMSRTSASIFGGTTAFNNNVGYSPFNYGSYVFDITAGVGSAGTNVKTFSRIILWPKSVSDSALQLISGQTT